MYRMKMESAHQKTAYKWYKDLRTAHLVAIVVIRNRDYDKVTIENLALKRIEKIYVHK